MAFAPPANSSPSAVPAPPPALPSASTTLNRSPPPLALCPVAPGPGAPRPRPATATANSPPSVVPVRRRASPWVSTPTETTSPSPARSRVAPGPGVPSRWCPDRVARANSPASAVPPRRPASPWDTKAATTPTRASLRSALSPVARGPGPPSQSSRPTPLATAGSTRSVAPL